MLFFSGDDQLDWISSLFSGNLQSKLFCFLWYYVLHGSKYSLLLYRTIEIIAITQKKTETTIRKKIKAHLP
jgi:hypothetical protein